MIERKGRRKIEAQQNTNISSKSRRRVLTGAIESTVGGLTMVAGASYSTDSRLPGSGFITRVVELVNFMPPTATRAVLASLLAAGSATLIFHGSRRVSRASGEGE